MYAAEVEECMGCCDLIIQKCSAKYGFLSIIVRLNLELQTLLNEAGMTSQEYVNFGQDLATNKILEKDWEMKLLASIREGNTTPLLMMKKRKMD